MYQKTFLPTLKGVDQMSDLRTTPQDRFLRADNATFDRQGRMRKRFGFTERSPGWVTTLTERGAIRGLFSTGQELCAIGYDRLYGFNPTTEFASVPGEGGWLDRGAVSPCVGRQSRVFYGGESYDSSDMGRSGDFMLYAACSTSSWTDSSGNAQTIYTLRCTGRTVDDVATLGPRVLSVVDSTGGSSDSTRPRAVRVLGIERSNNAPPGSDNFVITVERGGATSTSAITQFPTLAMYGYNSESPTTAPALISSDILGEALFYDWAADDDDGNQSRAYDMFDVHVLQSDFPVTPANKLPVCGIAYIDVPIAGPTGMYINIATFGADHSMFDSVQYAPADGCYVIAACWDPLATVAPGVAAIYVLVWRTDNFNTQDPTHPVPDPTTGDTLELYVFDAFLSYIAGPTIVDTLLVNEQAGRTLGIVSGRPDGQSRQVVCVWSKTTSGGSSTDENYWSMYSRSYSTSLVANTSELQVHSVVPMSKPWLTNNRFYVAANSYNSRHHAFGFSAIYDLQIDEDDADQPRYMALWNIGTTVCTGEQRESLVSAEGGSGARSLGSLQSVCLVGDDARFVWPSTTAPPVADPVFVRTWPVRVGSSEVRLGFAEPVVGVPVGDGAAVVGGGFVAYYSGQGDDACELGWPTPPFITDVRLVSDLSGFGVAIGDYFVSAIFEWFDAAGRLHRSMPAPAATLAMPTLDWVKYNARTLGGSHRRAADVTVAFYRTDLLGEMRLVYAETTHSHNISVANSDALGGGTLTGGAITTSHYETRDWGLARMPLYTNNHELEAVSPEGCTLMLPALDRLWLGGFFLGDRVQYSKSTSSSQAATWQTPPEFNELFALPLPQREDLTGMASMDDKLILFTSNGLFFVGGDGPDESGNGIQFQTPTQITAPDGGCVEPRSVVATPGGVMYRGHRGFYELDRQLSAKFIGFPVVDYSDAFPNVTSASLNEEASEVYFTCDDGVTGIVLVYNFLLGTWTRWLPRDAGGAALLPVGGCMHQGVYFLIEANGRQWFLDSSTFLDAGRTYVPLDTEWSWFQGPGPSSWQRVRRLMPMLAIKDSCRLNVELSADFETTPYESFALARGDLAAFRTAGQACQPVITPTRQKCQAQKVRIYDEKDEATSTGEGYDVAGLTVEWLPKKGIAKMPDAQRA